MIKAEKTALVLIDVQEKLIPVMHEKETMLNNLKRLIPALNMLEVPVLVTEQIPEKIGPTLPELAGLLSGGTPISKSAFSCCGAPEFIEKLEELEVTDILLTGIEAHVCVYQTARDLLAAGYNVHLVRDAITSRAPENRQTAFDAMEYAGAMPTCTETVIFELMRDAKHEKFRDILKLIKV